MATFTSALNKGYYVRLIVNQTSQNIANNTSTVSWELWVGNGSDTMQYNGQQLSASINGKTVHSSTQQITLLSKNMTVKIASGTETISHNADGTKTIACSGQWIPTGAYAPSATLTASGNLQLTTIPRASSVSLASYEVAYGSRLTINISRATSSFTHDVTITLPNCTQTYTGVATQQLFDIPLDWLNGYTNGVRASGTVTVQTKSGSTNIGSAVSVNFAAPVPSNIVPTLSVARTAFNSGLAGFNEPIQGISTMTLTRTAGGAYGSTITKTEWWANAGGISGSGDAVSFTVANVNPQYIYCRVTDSRGITAQVTYISWNHAYYPPSVTGIELYRCNSAGVADNEGTYVKWAPHFTSTSLGSPNLNTTSLRVYVDCVPAYDPPPAPWASGQWSDADCNGTLDKTKAYTLQITITDKIGRQSTLSRIIPVSEVLLNFPSSANALGIGMYSQGAGFLDIGYTTRIHSDFQLSNAVSVADLSTPGWYTLFEWETWSSNDSDWAYGTNFILTLNRAFASDDNEAHTFIVSCAYQNIRVSQLSGISNVQLFTTLRFVTRDYDSATGKYKFKVEAYYAGPQYNRCLATLLTNDSKGMHSTQPIPKNWTPSTSTGTIRGQTAITANKTV